MSIVVNETLVEVGETQERLYIFNRQRFRPIGNGFELLGVHSDAISTKQVSQVSHLWLIEFTFFSINEKFSITKAV